MTVRHGLLAILGEGACHGYQLKQEFEVRTGGSWPLNVAQVYSTLDRLVRDGLVIEDSARSDGARRYRITEVGRAEVARWLYSPGVEASAVGRDELPTKIAIALTLPGTDVAATVQAHRRAAIAQLQELNALKRDEHRSEVSDLGWELTLDAAVFAVKSRVQWLDHAEAKIARAQRESGALPYGLRDDLPGRGRPRAAERTPGDAEARR
ncbi:PadR family transcriptional regulator [Cryobacterium sp. Y57]|uniref:PadR family transcriptional regulator n=1 Tax=Cryobacterium sp. Y57 TaxID=2048287 RepID=UPI000CE3292B|nr:PadR family transcriptional regulator [Cryobacterium sp. Y57]